MATNIKEGELTSQCSDTTPLAPHDGSQLELAKDSLCGRICGPLQCWLCDPHKSAHGYVIVLLLCVAYLSLIFCYGNPAPLESSIVNVMQVDITQYELLFAVYSWPNAIVPLLGGILIDKVIGLRVGFILFITVACIGQFLVALAAYINRFWLMVVGRLIFGGGGKMATVCIDVFAAILFKKNKLSFVFGLIYSSGKIGSVFNILFSGKLYSLLKTFIVNNNARLGSTLLLGFGLLAFSAAVGLVAVMLDYRREKATGRKGEKQIGFKLKDIKDFSLAFWLFLFGSSGFYMIIFPFISIAQVFFTHKFSYQIGTANIVSGLVFIVPIISLPPLGLLFDWTGYKLFWGLGGVVLAILGHALLAFTGAAFFWPILATMLLGISFSIYVTAVWLQVFLLVQEHQSATAYGVLNCGVQLGQGVAALTIGVIVDRFGYFLVEILFIILGHLTLALIFALYLTAKGRILNISEVKRRKTKKQNENTSNQIIESRSSGFR